MCSCEIPGLSSHRQREGGACRVHRGKYEAGGPRAIFRKQTTSGGHWQQEQQQQQLGLTPAQEQRREGPRHSLQTTRLLQNKKQDRGAELHKASTDRDPTTETQPATDPEPDPESESLDPAAMRKKIVVVEEVIEDIDMDILTELALERAEGAPGTSRVVFSEQDWDHGLEEPEEKSWPNFTEELAAIR
ncbi:hypothetical protein SKAU_G00215580 [Synaphobranchus kaupii]|uniref:Uncharacterized protein n=1 Tax=Synaphobranchus kaupii TaxID=118154 RepID=A0A9Q1FAC3_SYNKA|nr:hypothetical protein SKAU_G00215580 [Synaphobranchus kaupii]